MDFPLHKNPKKLLTFFDVVRKEQVPDKVNKDFLKAHHFTSSYDESIPTILEQLDFVNSARIPKDRWKNYRDASQSKRVMGEAIRFAYADLFKTYSNPLEKNSADLVNFFRSKTDLDEKNVNYVVKTYESLVSIASFDQNEGGGLPDTEPPEKPKDRGQDNNFGKKGSGNGQYTINLNIQLQLPESTNPEVYDKLFESMKKHLFS